MLCDDFDKVCATHLPSHLTSVHQLSWLEREGRAFDPPVGQFFFSSKLIGIYPRFLSLCSYSFTISFQTWYSCGWFLLSISIINVKIVCFYANIYRDMMSQFKCIHEKRAAGFCCYGFLCIAYANAQYANTCVCVWCSVTVNITLHSSHTRTRSRERVNSWAWARVFLFKKKIIIIFAFGCSGECCCQNICVQHMCMVRNHRGNELERTAEYE